MAGFQIGESVSQAFGKNLPGYGTEYLYFTSKRRLLKRKLNGIITVADAAVTHGDAIHYAEKRGYYPITVYPDKDYDSSSGTRPEGAPHGAGQPPGDDVRPGAGGHQ